MLNQDKLEYNPPTLDPRSSLLHTPNYELNTPSLNDVSENTFVDSLGETVHVVERHYASTN